MQLSKTLKDCYSKEQYNAREAQQLAHIYSFGPIVFQVARLMVKYGIFDMLGQNKNGMLLDEIAAKANLSVYAAKCLMEASLTMQTVLVNPETNRYTLAKTGWFLLNDPLIRVDMDFNHDVNYEGWFHLDESLIEGKPKGLAHFGDWSTVYEGLSSLPENVKKSWFGFDHYYSDNSFEEALDIIFQRNVYNILDVGGNTGRFASRCAEYNQDVAVTICDLPQQIEMMKSQLRGKPFANRIHGVGMNLLDKSALFPCDKHYDVIWMSQFLDCFGEDDIVDILKRAGSIMDTSNRIYIMETLWDRQKYVPAAFCLTQISLYFTAIANGTSKMYNTDDMVRMIDSAGLVVDSIHDNLGTGGHSLIVCKLK